MQERAFHRAVVVLTVLFAIGTLGLSISDALNSPGVDLRCKVVGARRLLAHLDAYPSPATPEPREWFRLFNDNTYTPPLLLLYAPLSKLPYAVQRFAYLALDWLCVGVLFFAARRWFPRARSYLLYAFFALLVIGDFALRLHFERGQYYLLIAAFSAIAVCAWQRDNCNVQWRWLGAATLALLVLVRPTYLIAVVALWVVGYRRESKSAILIAVTALALLVAVLGFQPWIGYVKTVTNLQHEYLQNVFTPNPRAPLGADYQRAEGLDFSRHLSTNYSVGRTMIGLAGQASLRPIASRIFRRPAVLALVNEFLLLATVLCCLVVAARLRQTSPTLRLGFAFVCPILMETFGPQRYAYCDVTLTPILLLLLGYAFTFECNDKVIRRFIVGLAIVCCCAAVAPYLLSAEGKAIMVVSLARWLYVLVFVNICFLRLAAHTPSLIQENEEAHALV